MESIQKGSLAGDPFLYGIWDFGKEKFRSPLDFPTGLVYNRRENGLHA